MPDITMCANIKCEIRNKCYRYLANPSEYRQPYSVFGLKNKCDRFISHIEKDGVSGNYLSVIDQKNLKMYSQLWR